MRIDSGTTLLPHHDDQHHDDQQALRGARTVRQTDGAGVFIDTDPVNQSD